MENNFLGWFILWWFILWIVIIVYAVIIHKAHKETSDRKKAKYKYVQGFFAGSICIIIGILIIITILYVSSPSSGLLHTDITHLIDSRSGRMTLTLVLAPPICLVYFGVQHIIEARKTYKDFIKTGSLKEANK